MFLLGNRHHPGRFLRVNVASRLNINSVDYIVKPYSKSRLAERSGFQKYANYAFAITISPEKFSLPYTPDVVPEVSAKTS